VGGQCHILSFSVAISTVKALSSVTSGSMYFSLPNIINPIYIEQLREMIPPPIQNIVKVCNQITLLIVYCVSSRLVNFIKVADAPVQVSDILFLTVCFSFMILPSSYSLCSYDTC